MATIKDIAARLGVSISTVSKGLNGASDISEELRQTVLDTAVEMGYSTKRSRKVENRKLALFIENMNYESIDEFGYDVVLGFKQNAFKHKWDVDIIPVTPQLQAEEKYDTYILKNGYCGAFLVGFALHDEWMQQLKSTTMPTVLFDNYIENNPNVAYVGTDSYEGIDMAVKHLHNLGHKKIAFINGSLFPWFQISVRRLLKTLCAMPVLKSTRSSWVTATIFRRLHSTTFPILLQRALLLSSVAAMLSQRVLYLNASCTASMCQMI